MAVAVLWVCSLVPGMGVAQSADPFMQVVNSMVEQNGGKTICLPPSKSPDELKRILVDAARASGATAGITGQHIALAMWSVFPCPFSPRRDELRLAGAKDIEGVWLFPESSQSMRFGPAVKVEAILGPLPPQCDAVGYYEGGELRHAMIAGRMACPFSKAADMDIARQNPKVATWTMLRPGRVAVSRTDVPNHVEEWDMHVVREPFKVNEVSFETGDLIGYMRRERGNEFNASMQFRHLKRLP